MDDLLLGLASGIAVGALAALLVRRVRAAHVPQPPFERGLELRGRGDDVMRRAGALAHAAQVRAREEARALPGVAPGVGAL
jgi:hypothetical protein